MTPSRPTADATSDQSVLLALALAITILVGGALLFVSRQPESGQASEFAGTVSSAPPDGSSKLDDSVQAEAAQPEPATTAQTAQTAQTAPAQAPPEQLALAEAETLAAPLSGLAIVDGRIAERSDDDLRLLEFGETRKDTLAVLLANLGGPNDIVTGLACDSGPTDFYNWSGFIAAFRSGTGEFIGWSVGSQSVDLQIDTLDGLGIDSRISDLQAVDPRTEFVRLGPDWVYFDGGQTWLATSSDSDSLIYQIFNGEVCRLEADLAP